VLSLVKLDETQEHTEEKMLNFVSHLKAGKVVIHWRIRLRV
jgi:hypothetical protein